VGTEGLIVDFWYVLVSPTLHWLQQRSRTANSFHLIVVELVHLACDRQPSTPTAPHTYTMYSIQHNPISNPKNKASMGGPNPFHFHPMHPFIQNSWKRPRNMPP
jgi:hypothetical protein